MLDIFDILGPVMIGPSSSHTAGAARIGFIARALLGTPPVKAAIHLYGSFADPADALDYLERYDAAALDVRHLKNI